MALAVSVAGGLGIAVAALAANREASLDAQVPWLNLAVFAAVLAAGAQMSILVAARRSISIRQAVALAQIDERTARFDRTVGLVDASVPVTWDDHRWLHDPGCLVIGTNPARAMAGGEQREPCPICHGRADR